MRVAIVGGGIIGCLTAMKLKQQGADPVILERGRTGAESSWAGAGILCPIQPWLYPDAFTHLVQASLDLFPDLQDYLLTETGISMQWHRSGMIIPFFEDDAFDHESMATAWAKRFNWQSKPLSTDESLRQETCLNKQGLRSSLYWPQVAQLRNPRLIKAVRCILDKLNVPTWENCSVDGLNFRKNGHVAGVTIGGESMEADAVLLACGSWSGSFGKQAGIDIPVRPIKGQIVLLKGNNMNIQHIIKHESMYLVPRLDGRVLVGASMENIGFKRGNTVAEVHRLLDAVIRITPGAKDLEIEQQWMGFRPGSPDGMPFLGPVDHKPGLWLATGHYRNGVALAPITADIIARQILGESVNDIDLQPFDANRVVKNQDGVGYPQ